MTDAIETIGHVPLTLVQKTRLIVECAPAVFFLAVAAAYLTVLSRYYGGPAPGILLALTLVIGIVGVRAVRRLRDLMSGLACVEEDVLRSVLGRGKSSGRSGRFGEFVRLGRLRLTTAAFHRGQRGRRHRVVYSPASRIVWSLDVIG